MSTSMTSHALKWIDRSTRARIQITGPDCAKFLHNLVTNDIKKLEQGQGKEAFVTSIQGMTLGFILVHSLGDSLFVRTDPGALGLLLPHLNKFGVFDDVAIEDLSSGTFELHVLGDDFGELLAALDVSIPEKDLAVAKAVVGNVSVEVILERPAGVQGLTLIGPVDQKDLVLEALSNASKIDLEPIFADAFEAMRIAAGTPVFGLDVSPENLPQEIDRSSKSISFTKGCYLGQETVARLDALGHVNKVLRGMVVEGRKEPIAYGSVLHFDGKPVGAITSSAASPIKEMVVALGYLRAQNAGSGVLVDGADDKGAFQARVVALPFPLV